MTTVIKITKNKPEVPKLLCRCGTTGNGYGLPSALGGSQGMICVCKLIVWETWQGKDTVEQQPQQCKERQKRPHARREPVKTKPANKHFRTITEKQEENWRPVAILFLLMTCCFSLSSWHSWLSFYILFPLPMIT